MHKVRFWATEAARKFRHKEMLSYSDSDSIYSVASLLLLPKIGKGSIINFQTFKN